MLNNDKQILIDYAVNLFLKYKSFYESIGISFDFIVSSPVIRKHSILDYRRAIKKFNPVNGLSFDDKKIILLLIGMMMSSFSSGVNIWMLFNFLHRTPYKAILKTKRFLTPSRLIKSGIVIVTELRNYKSFEITSGLLPISELSAYFNKMNIYISPLFLSKFVKNIDSSNMGGLVEFLIPLSNKGYTDLDAFSADISSLMKYISFLNNCTKENDYLQGSFKLRNIYEKGRINKIIKRIQNNINRSKLKRGIINYLKEKKFSNLEFVLILFVIHHIINLKKVAIGNVQFIIDQFAFSPEHIGEIINALKKESSLVKDGFIVLDSMFPVFDDEENSEEYEDDIFSFSSADDYPADEYLSDPNINFNYNTNVVVNENKVLSLLFDDKNEIFFTSATLTKDGVVKKRDSVENNFFSERIKTKGLYEILIPRVKIENVILDDNVKNELLGAVDLTKAVDVMREWGVKPNLAASSFSSIKILLYGASGTGKTLTAEALAGEAGAELFKVDASNLVSPWVGESTKNVKRVFKEFYKYVKDSNKRVFLFMNEADQLLSARGTIVQAADKEYNQMQNLLLEELENFDGVFIATTNLPDVFDNAWNRRFNLKIKFDIPSYETRLKLWKVHIPEKMPISDDVDIKKLAEYELAGGSIANVVYNAARKAALRSENNRIVRQKDFIDAINQELKSHLGEKNTRVGF